MSLRGVLREFEVISLGEPSLLKSLLQFFPSEMLAVGRYLLPDFLGLFQEFLVEFILSGGALDLDLVIKCLLKHNFPMLFRKVEEILFGLDRLNTRLLRDDVP